MSTRLINICACPTHIAPYHVCGQSPRYPDDIPAGQELDALVAKRIFGLNPYGNHSWARPTFRGVGVQYFHCHACNKQWGARDASPPCEAIVAKPYSTSIAAAMETLATFRVWKLAHLMDQYRVEICGSVLRGHTLAMATAETAPLAICWAALQAKGVP